MGLWEPLFEAEHANSIQNYRTLEKNNILKSRRGNFKKRIADIYENIFGDIPNQAFEAEIKSILDTVSAIYSNPSARRDAVTQIRKLSSKLPIKENQSLFNNFYTLVDLVSALEQIPQPKNNPAKYDLAEKLTQSLRRQGKKFQVDFKFERWDVFIAHGREDTHLAEELYEHLLKGIKPFLDTRCLIPGDRWNQVLPKMQQQSDITVVLISSNTAESFYAQEEIVSAIQLIRKPGSTHRVIPIKLPGVTDTYGLEGIQSITVDERYGIDQAAQRIISIHQKIYRNI